MYNDFRIELGCSVCFFQIACAGHILYWIKQNHNTELVRRTYRNWYSQAFMDSSLYAVFKSR